MKIETVSWLNQDWIRFCKKPLEEYRNGEWLLSLLKMQM